MKKFLIENVLFDIYVIFSTLSMVYPINILLGWYIYYSKPTTEIDIPNKISHIPGISDVVAYCVVILFGFLLILALHGVFLYLLHITYQKERIKKIFYIMLQIIAYVANMFVIILYSGVSAAAIGIYYSPYF